MEEFFKQCVTNEIQIFHNGAESFSCSKYPNIFSGTWEECVERAKKILNWEDKNQKNKIEEIKNFKFSYSALYDKGFGTECITIGEIECASINDAQDMAEEKTRQFLLKQFGKKCICEEVKITPIK